jgi:hypothetical protein
MNGCPMLNDRAMLAMLRARYDYGQVSPGMYAVIKKIECDISWDQHADEFGRYARVERTTIGAD